VGAETLQLKPGTAAPAPGTDPAAPAAESTAGPDSADAATVAAVTMPAKRPAAAMFGSAAQKKPRVALLPGTLSKALCTKNTSKLSFGGDDADDDDE
jgi:hypothetical protein